MPLFKKPPYTKVTVSKKKDIPGGLWVKCGDCGELLYKKKLEENLMVCPKCNFHFTTTSNPALMSLRAAEGGEAISKDSENFLFIIISAITFTFSLYQAGRFSLG